MHKVKILALGDGAFGKALCFAMDPQKTLIYEWNRKNVAKNFFDITKDSLSEIDYVISVVQSSSIKAVFALRADWENIPIIIASKGFVCVDDNTTLQTNIFSTNPVAVLSGPSFAQELIDEKITVCHLASYSLTIFKKFSTLFKKHLIILPSQDVVYLQVAGATKNIYAFLGGMIDALDMGSNIKAALVPYIIKEMQNICIFFENRFVAEPIYDERIVGVDIYKDNNILNINERRENTDSISILPYIDDLILCMYSSKSRNYANGQAFINSGTASYGIEGLHALDHICSLNINIPVCKCIQGILNNHHDPKTAIESLISLLEAPIL